MTRKALTFPDIRFPDEKLNRVVQHIRGLTQELQKLQAMLDDGAAGQVLTKIDRDDYHATWGAVAGVDGGINGENLGAGAEVFHGLSGNTLQFRTLTEGANINLVVTDTGISINAPSGGIVQWDDIEGKPTLFPPTTHTHAAFAIGFDDGVAGLGVATVQAAIDALTGIAAPAPPPDTRGASFVSSGELTAGVNPVPVYIPFTGTIVAVIITTLGGVGDVVVDIQKDILANYPPDGADSIVGASPPTIVAGTTYADVVLAGWTTAVALGDVLLFTLDSVATFTGVFISLVIQPS